MNIKYYLGLFIITTLLFLNACKQEQGTIQPSNDLAYPPLNDDKPLPNVPYPGPETQDENQIINPNPFGKVTFELDPIFEDDTSISGKGPAGISLQVVDITFIEILGSGNIQDDNSFLIKLSKPISVGHLIGIELSTQKDPDTWLNLWELKGDQARTVPNIGYFLDTEISQPLNETQ